MSKFFDNIKIRKNSDNRIRSSLEKQSNFLLRVLRSVLVILAFLAIFSLISEYGFYLSTEMTKIARIINLIVLYGFLIQTTIRILIDKKPFGFIKYHRFESAIAILIFLQILFPVQISSILLYFNPHLTTDTVAFIYIIITQLLVILRIILGIINYSRKILLLNIQPSLLIAVSFLLIILSGTFLLLLPRSTYTGLTFIDALFTSTSAVCVTGLIVVDTAGYFTPVGHAIILGLVQVGGLGIMTLTTFISIFMGGSTQLKEYSTIQNILGEENLGNIKKTIRNIAIVTFIIELIGSISIYLSLNPSQFQNDYDHLTFSIFHSISAFCNAGFGLTKENLANPNLQYNYGILFTIMGLIVIGGIGFPVIVNLLKYFTSLSKRARVKNRLTTHSKIVIITTMFLILFGTIFIFFLEKGNAFKLLSLDQQIIASLFHSISARTAGFNSVDVSLLSIQSSFILMILMWIGASPASTGGGIKTTSFALAFLNLYAIASGKKNVNIFKKQISDLALTKAFSTIILSITYLGMVIFLLLLTENLKFEDIIFEAISALGTVGLSRGITPLLSDMGKGLIILTMFIGRIGLFTFLIITIKRKSIGRYEYTQENILIT
jgi:trk system potassium uptake protein